MTQRALKPPPPLPHIPLPQNPRRPRRSIIRSIRRQNLPLNRPIPLPILTLHRPIRHIPTTRPDTTSPRLDIAPFNNTLEDLERGERLVERHLVPALVDAREAEEAGLLYLPVHDGVRGADVGVACGGEAWGVDFVGYDFAAEPVAAGRGLVQVLLRWFGAGWRVVRTCNRRLRRTGGRRYLGREVS